MSTIISIAFRSHMITFSVLATALVLHSAEPAAAQFPTSMVATPFPNGGGVTSHGVAVDSNGIVYYVPVGASLVRQDPSFAPGDPAGITIIALPHPAVNLAIDTADDVWISCSDGFVTKYDPIGATFTNFGPVGVCSFLDHIHFHSDGNVYTTCLDAHYIIRVNQPGGTIDTFPAPTVGSATSGITGDFTGDLWSIERSAHNVVRAEPSLMVPGMSTGITEFPIPNSPYSPETVKGCLERIWFTGLTGGANGPRVDYIDINTLAITQFDVDPGGFGSTYGLAVDGNGNPWATDTSLPQIYGIDISTNTVSIFPTPSTAHHIAISPTTGNLWYTDFFSGVVRLVPDVPLTATCEPTEPGGIPTVSEWGLVIMMLLLSVGGKIYFGRRCQVA